MASALTATVKAKTAEVLTAVQETDWRAELEAFQQVGAAEGGAAAGAAAPSLPIQRRLHGGWATWVGQWQP